MTAKLETRTFLWLLLGISLGFLWMLQPFFGPVFWACAIAVIFYPLQHRILDLMPGRKNTAALATLTCCFILVILPIVFIVSQVATEVITVYDRIQTGEIKPAQYADKIQNAFPKAERAVAKMGVNVKALKQSATDSAIEGGKLLAQNTFSIGQNVFGVVLDFSLMLYLAFFMLRDGDQLIDLLVRALPLGDERERQLFRLFAEVTRATVKGNLVVAFVQGALGGIILWVLGFPGALLLGVLMAFSSLIPAVGPALVWVPISLYLLAIGEKWESLILVAYCVGFIGVVDNILRPILVGRDTKLPDYMVLLSTLGGLAMFGINGFVVGPLVAALFIAFWRIFMDEIHVNGEIQDEIA